MRLFVSIRCETASLKHEVIHLSAHVVSIRLTSEGESVASCLKVHLHRGSPAPEIPSVGCIYLRRTASTMAVREDADTVCNFPPDLVLKNRNDRIVVRDIGFLSILLHVRTVFRYRLES